MNRLIKNIVIIVLAPFMLPALVNAQGGGGNNNLAVAIASNHIDVTVGFNGSSIEVFGDRRDKNADIAIVVEGPRKDVTIWQKAKVLGTWVNRYYANFKGIPVYYNYAISNKKPDKALKDVMNKNSIGHEGIFLRSNSEELKKIKNIEVFKNALLQKNYDLGVFFEKPAEVKFLNDNFFRVSFKVPPSAPTGEYKISSFLIKKGKVIEHNTEILKVEQVGLNSFIYDAAHEYSFVYAITCIFLALFSGWLVSVLRVKP